ncbi:MAG: EAL domain-containing protein [Rhodoglobus sp.]
MTQRKFGPEVAPIDVDLSAELRLAVSRGEIVAEYQPQVDLKTGRIVAAEALARWIHPASGVVAPENFIPTAETTGVIHSLGRFMIEKAVEVLLDWRKAGIELELSVNVSAVQLTQVEFYDQLDDDLTMLAEAAPKLTIEITESEPILDTPSIAERLSELRDRGLGIAIDDFGVGHSDAAQLDRVPATELKIDQALTQDNSAEVTALLEAVVELAHWRGIQVVAEGVETREQLDRMTRLGCDRAQGYLLGRSMPRQDLEALLKSR